MISLSFQVKSSLLSRLRLLIFFSLIFKSAIKVICVPLVFSYLTAEAALEAEPQPAAATPVPALCGHRTSVLASDSSPSQGHSASLRCARQSKFSGECQYCLSFCERKSQTQVTYSFFSQSLSVTNTINCLSAFTVLQYISHMPYYKD